MHYASLCVFKNWIHSSTDDTMLMDLRIILFFYALNCANYASTMFPIIPVLYSYKNTAQLLSLYAKLYKTMQRLHKVSMTSLFTCSD